MHITLIRSEDSGACRCCSKLPHSSNRKQKVVQRSPRFERYSIIMKRDRMCTFVRRCLYTKVSLVLTGNIRVYCRIRPFLKGQNQKQTTIEYIGDNGELVVTNPSKIVKESHRLFKFNKVFGPASTQGCSSTVI